MIDHATMKSSPRVFQRSVENEKQTERENNAIAADEDPIREKHAGVVLYVWIL
jgi:hypothetical protein